MKPFTEALRYEYPDVKPSDVLIDAGCYEGRWAAEMHAKYGCMVIAFEPVPDFFHRCSLRFEKNSHNINVILAALGDHCGTVNIGVHGDQSGLYCGSAVRAEKVPMTTLDKVLNSIASPEIAVLKLNIEGSEFAVLEHMLRGGYAAKFRHIQVQPHRVVPNAEERWDAILKDLALTHDVEWAEPWCWFGFKRRAP